MTLVVDQRSRSQGLTATALLAPATIFVAICLLAPLAILFRYSLNDNFDYQSDIRNPRKSGIEGAVLEPEKHRPLFLWAVVINLPFLVYLFMTGDRFSNAWLGATIFMAAAYSVKYLRFKEIPLLDSFTSAFHYASPLLFGILWAGSTKLWFPVFVAYYVWAMANHAFGAIQDIRPDREAGIRSIATYLGATNTVSFCLFAYMVAAALPTMLFGKFGIIPTFLLLPYVGLALRALMAKEKEDNPVFHRSWQMVTYLNYIIGASLSTYLLSLVRH